MAKTFVIQYHLDTSDGEPIWCGFNDDLPVAAEGHSYEELVKNVWAMAHDMAIENGHVANESDVHLLFMAEQLLQQQEEEHAARLDAIRARIHNSLNDPRPDVGIDEAFERIEKFHALQA